MQSLVSIANLHWGGRVAQSPRLFPLFPLPPSATSACPSASLSLLPPTTTFPSFRVLGKFSWIRASFEFPRLPSFPPVPGTRFLASRCLPIVRYTMEGRLETSTRDVFPFLFFFFVSFLFPNWWNLFRRGSIGEVKRGKIEFIDYHSN